MSKLCVSAGASGPDRLSPAVVGHCACLSSGDSQAGTDTRTTPYVTSSAITATSITIITTIFTPITPPLLLSLLPGVGGPLPLPQTDTD